MSLSTAAKDYIASHFGAGTPKCFVSSGISYTDPAGRAATGSTQDVVSTLKMDAGGDARGPNGETYQNIVSANGGNFLSNTDIAWIGNSQSGSAQYCVGVTPPPTVCTPGAKRCRDSNTVEQCKSDGTGWTVVQTCSTGYKCMNGSCVPEDTPTPPPTDKPVTGPLEVYVGGGESCVPGTPEVTLDTSEAYAFFKSTPYEYIGVGGIMVHNVDTTCRAYFAWEARMWDGYGYITCPATDPIHQEINRFLAEAGRRPLSLKRLDASGTDEIWGSFEVLPAMEGEYTLCLSLWGNFDYEALIAELNAVGYYDKT